MPAYAAALVALVAATRCSDSRAPSDRDDDAGVIRVTGVVAAPIIELGGPETGTVVIGSEGDPDYEFHRVADLMPLNGGGAAVLDASRRLRYFDEEGRLITAAGGPGEGPGEFVNPVGIQRVGDLLAVLDLRLARVSLYAGDGSLAGVLQAPQLPAPSPRGDALAMVPASLVGMLSDSTLVVHGPSYFLSEGSPGWRRVVGPIRLIDLEGIEQLHLGETSVMQFYEAPDESPPIRNSPHAAMMSIAVLDRRVAVTSGDAFEITVIDDGRALHYREDRGPAPAPARGRPDEALYPPMQPTYRQVILDPNGRILVREYELDPDAPQLWTVLDRDGTVHARYRMPAGFRLSRSWNGVLYGVWIDDLGVESIGWFTPQ